MLHRAGLVESSQVLYGEGALEGFMAGISKQGLWQLHSVCVISLNYFCYKIFQPYRKICRSIFV